MKCTVPDNELYRGRLVWNRLRYMKDPDTGKRRSRANTDESSESTRTSDSEPPGMW